MMCCTQFFCRSLAYDIDCTNLMFDRYCSLFLCLNANVIRFTGMLLIHLSPFLDKIQTTHEEVFNLFVA